MAFLVFEGIDGAGKSTLMGLVEKELARLSVPFIKTRDPGSTELGEKLRNIILDTKGEAPVAKAELLLYQTCRVQMVDKIIRPAKEQGQWILSDRFYSSTLAFQFSARGLQKDAIHFLNEFVAEGCHPDLFIFIDITVEESRKRMGTRGNNNDRMESEGDDFHNNVRAGYTQQAQDNPDKWLVLDGTRTPQQLCTDVIEELKKRKWLA